MWEIKIITGDFFSRKKQKSLCLRNEGFQIFGCKFGERFFFFSQKKSPVQFMEFLSENVAKILSRPE
jgi:hypothetical protein